MNFTMHNMDSKQLFRSADGPREDFAVLAPLPQEYKGRWKQKGFDLVVLGLCEEYAKGPLSITFHSSKVTISVTATTG